MDVYYLIATYKNYGSLAKIGIELMCFETRVRNQYTIENVNLLSKFSISDTDVFYEYEILLKNNEEKEFNMILKALLKHNQQVFYYTLIDNQTKLVYFYIS